MSKLLSHLSKSDWKQTLELENSTDFMDSTKLLCDASSIESLSNSNHTLEKVHVYTAKPYKLSTLNNALSWIRMRTKQMWCAARYCNSTSLESLMLCRFRSCQRSIRTIDWFDACRSYVMCHVSGRSSTWHTGISGKNLARLLSVHLLHNVLFRVLHHCSVPAYSF
jgi:hypothetical protein